MTTHALNFDRRNERDKLLLICYVKQIFLFRTVIFYGRYFFMDGLEFSLGKRVGSGKRTVPIPKFDILKHKIHKIAINFSLNLF